MQTIVVPITDNNRQGIDDVLDAVKPLFSGEVIEAYIIKTDDPGMIAVAKSLAQKSELLQPKSRSKPGPKAKALKPLQQDLA